MNTTDATPAADRGSGCNDLLGPVGVLLRGDGGAWRFSCGDFLLGLYRQPMGEHKLFTEADVQTMLAAERERWRELAEHLRHCRECGETDVSHCHEGASLWKRATGDDLGA